MAEYTLNKIVANSRIIDYLTNDMGYIDFNNIDPEPPIDPSDNCPDVAWRMENWGCSSNALNPRYIDDYITTFNTESGKPLNVFKKICKLFSNTYITFECVSPIGKKTIYNNLGGELLEME